MHNTHLLREVNCISELYSAAGNVKGANLAQNMGKMAVMVVINYF